MEDTKTYGSASSVELEMQMPHTAYTRNRNVPDVPEDVDFIMEHLNDPNLDLKKFSSQYSHSHHTSHHYPREKSAYDRSDVDHESQIESDRYSNTGSRNSTAIDFEDESPYPEVRAAVSNVDDPLMPVNTFRMWLLGLMFSILVSGLNQVFSMRFPSVLITGIVVQLVSLPFGKFLEKVLPTKRFKTFGYTWSLNPGPFNVKEHVCITVMANVSVGGAYATDVIATQRIFYNQQFGLAYQVLLCVGTQVLGFSLGGMLRQFVVWPSSMIWPGALVNAALFNTLHKNFGKKDPGHMTRERFFLLVLVGSFVWYWIPGYLFTALSVFNWVCWIAPNNVTVNALFGTNSGLGMGIFTFDWAMISYIGSPLVTPWWSELNTAISFVIFFWIIVPILYFTNSFYTSFLPISTYLSFDNTGAQYNVSMIVTDGVFDVAKYRAYSPVYISTTLIMAYCVAFAAFPAVFVHTFLWFRRDIVRRFRSSLKDERDIHSRLMQVYPEVPIWWYAIVGVVSFVFVLVAIEIFPTQLPIWAAVFAFILATALSVPLAMLQAITNQQAPLQVMHEMIAGYILPGRPVANMIFKTMAYISTTQAVGFAGDLKLGHYMKVPPRMMFAVQIVASAIASIVTPSVQDWMFEHVVDVCTHGQKDGYVCPSTNTFATASLIWGGVGPARLFSPGKIYSPVLWFFLVGTLAPIPFYYLARRFPLSFWRYINIPVFFAGVGAMPPASGINYASWAIVGFIFNYLIRRFRFRWWMRYNYILSAGLDAGLDIASVVIFFAVLYTTNNFSPQWWGNTGWINTADANGLPLKTPNPSIGFFGPSTWS